MGELGIALVAAGSALVGSGLTGWFTIAAGRRQAAAARYAGDEQARAVIDTVNRTLDEQRAARVEEARRQVYTQYLMAYDDAWYLFEPHSSMSERLRGVEKVNTLHGVIELEGPEEVRGAASRLRAALLELAALHDGRNHPEDFDDEERWRCQTARRAFIVTAQAVLHGAP
ncbi:hypothetical protein ACIRP5_31240 [Streptomyces sp. NPDC101221]|uniref:hypothetical protein n=1 Tax=Streptomyces sp. NPDC101221 TaxID=3366132 RepID=UPI0038229EBF